MDAWAVGPERDVQRNDLLALAERDHPVVVAEEHAAGPLHDHLRAEPFEERFVELPARFEIANRDRNVVEHRSLLRSALILAHFTWTYHRVRE
jgi:hypothetical protein